MNRVAFDEFGYALRGTGLAEGDVRRVLAYGIETFPNGVESCLHVTLARLLYAQDLQRQKKLHKNDPVAYAIGWGSNEDASKRERPPGNAWMRSGIESLRRAQASLQKNGAGHREYMDAMLKELTAALTDGARPEASRKGAKAQSLGTGVGA